MKWNFLERWKRPRARNHLSPLAPLSSRLFSLTCLLHSHLTVFGHFLHFSQISLTFHHSHSHSLFVTVSTFRSPSRNFTSAKICVRHLSSSFSCHPGLVNHPQPSFWKLCLRYLVCFPNTVFRDHNIAQVFLSGCQGFAQVFDMSAFHIYSTS